MATAIAYDEWFQPDLAEYAELDASVIAEWDVQSVATQRIGQLVHWAQVIGRARQLGISRDAFWSFVEKKMLDHATWYARAVEVPGIDREAVSALPDASSREGKELTLVAQLLSSGTPQEWLDKYRLSAIYLMTRVVTMGRLRVGVGSWSKANRSLSNKLANAVKKEVDICEKFQIAISSSTAPAVDIAE